jgi:hypothetical protein
MLSFQFTAANEANGFANNNWLDDSIQLPSDVVGISRKSVLGRRTTWATAQEVLANDWPHITPVFRVFSVG